VPPGATGSEHWVPSQPDVRMIHAVPLAPERPDRTGRSRSRHASRAKNPAFLRTNAYPGSRARVSELADDLALKAKAPQGACGFESHPGHPISGTRRPVRGAGSQAGSWSLTGWWERNVEVLPIETEYWRFYRLVP